MLKRLLTTALAVLVLHLAMAAPVSAGTQAEKDARLAQKVKESVGKFGTGEKAHIHVTLKDKTKLKGYVSAISEDGFSVTDAQTGAATNVAYTQVKAVRGNNLSTGVKIAIGVGIAFGVLVIVALIGVHEVRNSF